MERGRDGERERGEREREREEKQERERKKVRKKERKKKKEEAKKNLRLVLQARERFPFVGDRLRMDVHKLNRILVEGRGQDRCRLPHM
jgi:hypothetical protein